MKDDQSPLPYMDDIETIPLDEADDVARVVQAMQLLLARHKAKSGEFVADVHVKTHGYAAGEFRVLPRLPAELAQGLFRHDAVYPSVVRFSNAASQGIMGPSVGCKVDEHCVEFAECGRLSVAGLD